MCHRLPWPAYGPSAEELLTPELCCDLGTTCEGPIRPETKERCQRPVGSAAEGCVTAPKLPRALSVTAGPGRGRPGLEASPCQPGEGWVRDHQETTALAGQRTRGSGMLHCSRVAAETAMSSPAQAHALHQRVMQPHEERCLRFSHNRRVALGIAQPRHNCCWALESCSTLPPNQHWMIATATEISSTARVRDPLGPPCSGRRAPLHAVPEGSPRRALGNPQQRHPFERDPGSACELLHTPERMPTSVATYRLS